MSGCCAETITGLEAGNCRELAQDTSRRSHRSHQECRCSREIDQHCPPLRGRTRPPARAADRWMLWSWLHSLSDGASEIHGAVQNKLTIQIFVVTSLSATLQERPQLYGPIDKLSRPIRRQSIQQSDFTGDGLWIFAERIERFVPNRARVD